MQYTVEPIGFVHSCYNDKFGIPRQPGLVSAATAEIHMVGEYAQPEAFEGLAGCSHIWLEFIFHAGFKGRDQGAAWQPRVRPPRLGGNARLGVFATRSPNRPNRLGLSVVELAGLELEAGRVVVHIRGHDLLQGTPVIDIKPYVPYVDALPGAVNGFASAEPQTVPVHFLPQADPVAGTTAATLALAQQQALRELVQQVLQQDPRPSYHQLDETRVYGTGLNLGGQLWQVRWRYREEANCGLLIEVVEISGSPT